MALSDSMFLFEIGLKDLKSYLMEDNFRMIAQFADVFDMTVRNPIINYLRKQIKKVKVKQRCKVRNNKVSIKVPSNINTQTGQSVLVIKKPSHLMSNMKKYPLKISLCKEKDPNCVLGSTIIPWKNVYTDYLRKVYRDQDLPPPYTEGLYSIYDDLNSKRIVSFEMSVKLTYLSNKMTSQFRSISENDPTFIYTEINSKPTLILSTVKNQMDGNSGNNVPSKDISSAKLEAIDIIDPSDHKDNKNSSTARLQMERKFNTVISDIQIGIKDCNHINKSISCSSISVKQNEAFKYIFGDPMGTFGNQVYCVGYFTVEKDSPQQNSETASDTEKSSQPNKYKFSKCDSDCREKNGSTSGSAFSLNIPEAAAQISLGKCKEIDCDNRIHRKLPPPPDDRILLNVSNAGNECCVERTTEETIVGEVTAKMKIGEDPCFCSCECTFGFSKKTTYCNVCGGYELAGDDLAKKPVIDLPTPCPIFHKLIDKNKLKTWSTSGSESKKKGDDQKSLKAGSGQKAATSDKRQAVSEKKSVESEKDSKKGKKKNKDERFQFNYGYKGIPPQIGHSNCALPCSGTLDNVPKNMGWLWTAENVPGMKFRPMWKPGATSKHVVRLLKIARHPGEIISKKKRKDMAKKKRALKRPLLIVHKKDGEYTVTMETMKSFAKPRAINQQPYEDKPVLTYTIGRTDEENRERHKKKERERRRLERAQRQFIQSTFRDMCHEICLKTYQQALGILPDAEDPECLCYPALPTPKTTNMDISCSCSEDRSSMGSDTDSDEWIVEFTPPNALFDPTYKGKKVFKVDNGSQYTYLDYRVKLLDRFGNPVPRYFKGPDGKQQCSDLGGFWNPEHKWLEINVDGYIAPDGRWAPNNFIGPSGEQVDAETGKFQATNGQWLVVGVDGFIDSQGKWRFYPKAAGSLKKKRRDIDGKKVKPGEKKYEKSETSWSCFGDASPKRLSKLGIVGHGGDRKLLMSTLQDMLAHGEDVSIPQPKTVFHLPPSKKGKRSAKDVRKNLVAFRDRGKCHHSIPSSKGIVAVDADGNKTYFKLRNRRNLRPKERMATLADRGISLSSFHVPCFHSFINAELLKRQLRERNMAYYAGKNVATQVK